MQLLAIILVRSRTDWCAGVESPLAGDCFLEIARKRASYNLNGYGSMQSDRALRMMPVITE